jgi:hypothetical protein
MFMVASLLGWEPLLGLDPLRNLVGGLVWVEGRRVFVLIVVFMVWLLPWACAIGVLLYTCAP